MVTEKTKAIVCVHYGGLPCDLNELIEISNYYNIPIIQDSAHAIGAKYDNKKYCRFDRFLLFLFPSNKINYNWRWRDACFKNESIASKAKRMRWFGIDREKKNKGIWENDIVEIGYKYQMTDIAASMGISGLDSFVDQLHHRKSLFNRYRNRIKNISDVHFIDNNDKKYFHSAWLCTVLVENRINLQNKLMNHKIESSQVHYRNDKYSIFSKYNTLVPW